MRRLISIPCEGETLAATLDEAAGDVGLLIVSGGNEVRSGAHRGMALLAQRLADAGIPVFRYDRRGVGDSIGENGGYLSAKPDLAAAVAAFRVAVPSVARIAGFGNCDAASTLALFGRDAGIDSIILANPWIVEQLDDLPPAAAIRARYAKRLRDPASWLRLLRGGVNILRFFSGLKKIYAAPSKDSSALGVRVMGAIDGWQDRVTILIASGDTTAQAFAAEYRGVAPTIRFDTASHSFAGVENAARLEAEIVAALRRT